MTFTAHAVSASILSLMIAKVDPSQTGLLMTALIVPAALDLDHVVLIIKHRKMFAREGYIGNLSKARSFMHELLGVLIMGLVYFPLSQFDKQLATVVYFSYLIHVIEDMFLGTSYPFSPINKKECKLFNFSFKQKAIVEICTIIISLLLWARFLKG